MDRTLVDIHTGRLFLRFLREQGEISLLEIARKRFWLFQYGLGWVNAEQVAIGLGAEYRDQPEEQLRERCRLWFASHVRSWVSNVGRKRVRQHQAAGHAVAMVTSSLRQMAQPLADELSIPHLICSDLVIKDRTFTGSFELPLCYGAGKLARASELVTSLGSDLQHTVFYTDSITDVPLLAAVGHPIAVNPDVRLRRLARSRGWQIEEWTKADRPGVFPAWAAFDSQPSGTER